MQALFSTRAYLVAMTTKKSTLRTLREQAGLTLRELSRMIGENPSNVCYWETSGQTPRSDVLLPIAKALGITVEELLGESKPIRVVGPGGRLGQVLEAASKLPRRQQQKIAEVVEALISQHNHHGKTA